MDRGKNKVRSMEEEEKDEDPLHIGEENGVNDEKRALCLLGKL